jgi:hypothetical protein
MTAQTAGLSASPVVNNKHCSLADLSFAMYEASERCGSVSAVAETLNLPSEFVVERIEAARLCLLARDLWT